MFFTVFDTTFLLERERVQKDGTCTVKVDSVLFLPFFGWSVPAVTMLGEQWAVVSGLSAVIYWVIDKNMGEEFAFTLLISGLCNNILKGVFRFERPIGQEGIRTLRAHTATGYSFPSGHSQNAATLYFFRLAAAADGAGLPLARSVCW